MRMTNEKKERIFTFLLSLALSLSYVFLNFDLMASLWASIIPILQMRKLKLGKIKM